MTTHHIPSFLHTAPCDEEIRGHLQHASSGSSFPVSSIRIDQINLNTTLAFQTVQEEIHTQYPAIEEITEDLSVLQHKLDRILTSVTRRKYEAKFKNEFLRRIPAHEREQIIDNVLKSPLLTPEQLEAFSQGNWDHSVFQEPDKWRPLVFQAYFNDQIDEMQASKLFLYNQCCQESDHVETLQLLNADGTLNEEAAEILLAGLGSDVFRTQEEKQEMLQVVAERFRSSPEKGQFFVVAPRHLTPLPRPFIPTKETDVAQMLFHEMNWSYCLVESIQFVLPPELGYEILKTKYHENTMVPLPVLGFSEKERFSETERRVVGIPCSDVTPPQEADGFPATGLTLYHHDMAYHIVLESANYFRKAWVELAGIFKQQEPALYRVILDREFPFYVRLSEWGSQEEKFWLSLVDFMMREERLEIGASFAQYIEAHADEWKEKYGLELSHLTSASRLRIDPSKFTEERQQKMIRLRQQTRRFTQLFHRATV